MLGKSKGKSFCKQLNEIIDLLGTSRSIRCWGLNPEQSAIYCLAIGKIYEVLRLFHVLLLRFYFHSASTYSSVFFDFTLHFTLRTIRKVPRKRLMKWEVMEVTMKVQKIWKWLWECKRYGSDYGSAKGYVKSIIKSTFQALYQQKGQNLHLASHQPKWRISSERIGHTKQSFWSRPPTKEPIIENLARRTSRRTGIRGLRDRKKNSRSQLIRILT